MARRKQTKCLDMSVEVYGKSFLFHLQRRPVDLGPGLTVQYHWMDISEIRKGTRAKDIGLQNLMNCIHLWWQIVRAAQQDNELHVIQQFLLAHCYLLLARSKGQNRVYLDAFPGSTPRYEIDDSLDLPLEEVTSATVGSLLEATLLGDLSTDDEQLYANFVIAGTLDWGVTKFRENQQQGLEEFLGKIESWYAARRRRGNRPLTTRTLDVLAHASKVAFYECYSNTWIALIEKLEQLGMDESSSSFLRFWHYQNFQQTTEGRPAQPLGGLILGLHPISAYLMKAPARAAACGDFFRDLTSKSVDENGFGEWLSYRNFLRAIVNAAGQYRRHLDSTQVRRTGVRGSGAFTRRTGTGVCEQLAEFFRESDRRCPYCGGALGLNHIPETPTEGTSATLHVTCEVCEEDSQVNVTSDELIRHLMFRSESSERE